MTTTQENTTAQAVELITVVIDGFEVSVPKGTLVIRAAEKLGIQIPRFCDHPLLDPVGACRQCLVDIEINGRAFPKPQASCTIPVEPNMNALCTDRTTRGATGASPRNPILSRATTKAPSVDVGGGFDGRCLRKLRDIPARKLVPSIL